MQKVIKELGKCIQKKMQKCWKNIPEICKKLS